MQKVTSKILVLFILLASLTALDAHEFLHSHESGFDSQCNACILSTTLISDDLNSGDAVIPYASLDFILKPEYKTFLSDSHQRTDSDRAPPSS